MKQQATFRGRALALVAAAAAAALGGCASFTMEDFSKVLDGVNTVAQAGGQFEANRRANKPQAQPSTQVAAAPAAPQYQAQQQAYGALSCASVGMRNGSACVQNNCGQAVAVSLTSGGSLSVGAGQCVAIPNGTRPTAVCRGGDTFSPQRGGCVKG